MDDTTTLHDRASAYLRMHADDPVAWLPWSHRIFERARVEDRLVLLSVGYSSCHWCHVMQRESFRDEATAEFLNAHFLSVKVDREERPDIDALYMDYVAAATGSGGWPMTVVLTPDALPVFGGTYFPLHAREGVPSFMDVLRSVYEAWIEDRDVLEQTAEAALDFLERRSEPPAPAAFDEHLIETAAAILLASADPVHGGFGRAPKFPQIPLLGFLLRFAEETGDDRSAQTVFSALRSMVRGGIFDQAGGGMFRYATDAAWLVPHFEKMLYDNALLLGMLGRAIAYEPDDEFAHAIHDIADFLERDLATGDGTYAASLSAETEGVEGATYVWTHDELANILAPGELACAERSLRATPEGNWDGSNILTRADGRGPDAEDVDAVLARLAHVRGSRPQPARDDKVIVSWNAMAARGLMEAGEALDDDGLLSRGRDLTWSLYERAVGDGVIHVLDDTDVAAVRLLEDAAHLTAALITVYETTDDDRALDAALELHEDTVLRFVADGVAYMTDDTTDLPVRPREQNDAPLPSGAATLAENALRLDAYAPDTRSRPLAADVLSAYASLAEFAPSFAGSALETALTLVAEED